MFKRIWRKLFPVRIEYIQQPVAALVQFSGDTLIMMPSGKLLRVKKTAHDEVMIEQIAHIDLYR